MIKFELFSIVSVTAEAVPNIIIELLCVVSRNLWLIFLQISNKTHHQAPLLWNFFSNFYQCKAKVVVMLFLWYLMVTKGSSLTPKLVDIAFFKNYVGLRETVCGGNQNLIIEKQLNKIFILIFYEFRKIRKICFVETCVKDFPFLSYFFQ